MTDHKAVPSRFRWFMFGWMVGAAVVAVLSLMFEGLGLS
jgi:hypothetical protein